MQSYALLEAYTNEEDLAYYQSLYTLHYASETSNFDRQYIGDAILLLADRLIQNNHDNSDAILNIITSVNSGLFECEYENNLFNAQEHTKTINALKELHKKDPNDAPSLCEMLKEKFCKKEEKLENFDQVAVPTFKKIENLEEKHIAYYKLSSANSIAKQIKKLGTKEVNFSRSNKLSGLSLIEDSKDLALQKAGRTLLDAYDCGAEVIVVDDIKTLEMFEDNFKNIEKAVGRKMRNLELMSIANFNEQV